MGQTVADNGIMNHVTAGYSYSSDLGVKEQESKTAAKNNVYRDNGVESVGYKYEKNDGINTIADTVMDNFEEYLKYIQEKAKEAGTDDASREREAKENAREIAGSLSQEELKRLEMMGIDIESVRLSDIMGLVNTMRGNAHREEMKQMMAKISVENGDTENVVVSGSTVKAACTDIALDNIAVSEVIAEKTAAEKIVADDKDSASADKTVADDKDSVSAEKTIAGNTDNFRLSEKELIYLLRNNKAVTQENLYMAHYSGSRNETAEEAISDRAFSEMLPQIEKVIEQAGCEVNDDSISGARLLIGNQIPCTTDNIRAYMDFRRFDGRNIEDVISWLEAGATAAKDKADMLYQAVMEIESEVVYEMAAHGRQITIASALHYMRQQEYSFHAEVKNDAKALTAMRQMEEIRLSMTEDAAARLVKLDLNIDTRELSKVVSALRSMEQKMISDSCKSAGLDVSAENIELYRELSDKVWSVGEASAKLLASPLGKTRFTVNALYAEAQELSEGVVHSEGTSGAGGQSFETVKRSYEVVGTAPRRDMGDSIAKAFSNVDDILRELELPESYENQRAVRILGYNSMDITRENIASVVNYDRQVNMLLDSFYPEAVLGIIKDGINPLDMPIDELNQVIRDRNYNEGVTEVSNYAAFLRDIERQGEISPEERESYIGIYRAMDKLAKSGDREAGWLFANGGRLTIRNLVAAMRSRKASGMDVSVDESFGMLESAKTDGKRIDEQIESGFRAGEKLDGAEEKAFEGITENEMEEARREAAEKFLVQNNIDLTMINITAAHQMLSADGGIYQLVSDILAKLRFKTNAKDNLIDQETENMSDSLSGEDILPEFTTDSIIKSLCGSREMSLKYEELRDRVTELMYEYGIGGTLSGADISAIKTVNTGFNILSAMARNDRYQVPVETEQGIKVMNLTIRHGKTYGNIDISVSGEQMGMVSAVIHMGASGSAHGYIVSSVSEGNYRLAELKNEISGQLEKDGFDGTNIVYGSVNKDIKLTDGTKYAADNAENADAGTLYNAAVALVKAIGGVIC